MGPHAHKLTPEQVERVVELEAAIEAAVMAGQYAQTGRIIRAWQEATTPTSLQRAGSAERTERTACPVPQEAA